MKIKGKYILPINYNSCCRYYLLNTYTFMHKHIHIHKTSLTNTCMVVYIHIHFFYNETQIRRPSFSNLRNIFLFTKNIFQYIELVLIIFLSHRWQAYVVKEDGFYIVNFISYPLLSFFLETFETYLAPRCIKEIFFR